MTTRWDVERAVTSSNIDSRGRLIVLALLTKADNTTARTTADHTPSFSTLCAMTGLSKAVMSEWMQALEDGGWVARTNPSSGGKGNRTIYELRPGTDKIERRSRDLRKPRKPPNSSPSEPFEEGQTVRPADGIAAPNSSPSEPQTVRPANPNGSPSERATTPPLPTGEGGTKNHHGARGAEKSPKSEAVASSKWADSNLKPTTPAAITRTSDALFPKPRRVDVDRLTVAHQTIYWWLQANGFANFGADEIQEIHSRLIVAHGTKLNPGYLRAVIGNGGALPLATEIRKARNAPITAAIKEMQATMPQCIHGTPAGNLPHPTTGDLLCLACRRGLPAAEPDDATNPAVQEILNAYRSTRGNDIRIKELIEVTQQIEAFLAEGANPEDLVTLAQAAGANRTSLIQAAGVAA